MYEISYWVITVNQWAINIGTLERRVELTPGTAGNATDPRMSNVLSMMLQFDYLPNCHNQYTEFSLLKLFCNKQSAVATFRLLLVTFQMQNDLVDAST